MDLKRILLDCHDSSSAAKPIRVWCTRLSPRQLARSRVDHGIRPVFARVQAGRAPQLAYALCYRDYKGVLELLRGHLERHSVLSVNLEQGRPAKPDSLPRLDPPQLATVFHLLATKLSAPDSQCCLRPKVGVHCCPREVSMVVERAAGSGDKLACWSHLVALGSSIIEPKALHEML